MFDGRTGHP
jgi:hypothetical protein